MAYNKFRWWITGRIKKPLPPSKPLLDRIRNGDFEYSPYFEQAESYRKISDELFDTTLKNSKSNNYLTKYMDALNAGRMKRVRALKLDDEAHKHESNRLCTLRKALFNEFGFDLWDSVMDGDFDGNTEDLYWYYKNELK